MASAAGSVAAASATTTTASTRCRRRRVAVLLHRGASAHTLVPIRPRWRGERRSLRTLPGTSLRPPHVCDATTDGDGDGEVGEVGANDDANDASSSSSSSIADAPSRAAASAAVRALADRVLPNGASVNDRDDETGETALVVASERGDLDDVRALLAVGAVRFVVGFFFGFSPHPRFQISSRREVAAVQLTEVWFQKRAARRTSRSRPSPGGPRSTAPRKTAPSRALKRSSTPART